MLSFRTCKNTNNSEISTKNSLIYMLFGMKCLVFIFFANIFWEKICGNRKKSYLCSAFKGKHY